MDGQIVFIILMVFIVFAIIVAVTALQFLSKNRKPTDIPGTIKVVTDRSDGETYITVELNSYADLEKLKRSKTVILKVNAISVK